MKFFLHKNYTKLIWRNYYRERTAELLKVEDVEMHIYPLFWEYAQKLDFWTQNRKNQHLFCYYFYTTFIFV